MQITQTRTLGILGMSRSGKTTLAHALAIRLPGKVAALHLDDFVLPEHQLPRITHQGETRTDWEQPCTVDFLALREAIAFEKEKHDWVIAEGFLLLADANMPPVFTDLICLEVTYETFWARRVPTYTPREPDWYIQHVWDSYQQYQAPVLENKKCLTYWPEKEVALTERVLRDLLEIHPDFVAL